MDYRTELLSQVERVLVGTLSVSEFEARFYDFYMDGVPEDALAQSEHDFVVAICEKLDVTAERPDAESRRGGWIDHAQFLDWLREHHAAFRRSMAGPELVLLSRDRAERYQPRGVEICISITDPRASEARLAPEFAAVLRLQFSDIAAPGGHRDVPFGREHAERILEFIARWPHAERIVVHCTAGASRSPGVALGLCDRFGWPAAAIEQAKPFWNSLVRRVLAGQ